MKIYHPDSTLEVPLVTDVASYEAAYREVHARWLAYDTAFEEKSPYFREMMYASNRFSFVLRKHNLPHVLVAKCPFTQIDIWYKFTGVFSLSDHFWYQTAMDAKRVSFDSNSPYLFCVDGVLNLNGQRPTNIIPNRNTQTKRIRMSAEVPFVKPRVLAMDTMVAVIHSVPVADKYTAYIVTYFAQELPSQREFCVPWGCEQVSSSWKGGSEYTYWGWRQDAQDYDLEPWLQQKKILWLDPETEDHLLSIDDAPFPYLHVNGRKHPYKIENGEIIDLPNPVQDEGDYKLDGLR